MSRLSRIHDADLQAPRDTCWRCRRPRMACWCEAVTVRAPACEVIILQHPRERHVPIGTARMAAASLSGARLIEGVFFDDDARLADAFADAEGCAVVFPGDGATPLEAYVQAPPRRLIFLDGTWSQAGVLLRENPRLAALPRLGFSPPAPGRYRIRKEPDDDFLSTIEAVAWVVGTLEGDVDGYHEILRPFDVMVEGQLAQLQQTHAAAAASGSRSTTRHARRSQRRRKPDARFLELLPIVADPARAVVVYAEANAHPGDRRDPGVPELIHVVATRPFVDGAEVFSRVCVPTRRVHPEVLSRLGLHHDDVAAGVSSAVAIAELQAFVGDGSLMCWGAFPRDLLHREGAPRRGFIDLRALSCRALGGSAGGLDVAAGRLSSSPSSAASPSSTTSSRAQRRLADAVDVSRALLALAQAAQRKPEA